MKTYIRGNKAIRYVGTYRKWKMWHLDTGLVQGYETKEKALSWLNQ